LFHFLLQTPRAYQAIKDEVDNVCGSTPIKFEQLQKLEYLDAALKEALRLKSTAPGISVTPKHKDEVIGGKYLIPKDHHVMVVLDTLHTDPKVWGEDAHEFR
jgi:cytochrome P450/NADPH-cytochrome P450 reductase